MCVKFRDAKPRVVDLFDRFSFCLLAPIVMGILLVGKVAAEPAYSAAPTSGDSRAVIGEVPEAILALLREDVRGRAGSVKGKEPGLVRAQSQVWPSGAMGCPQLGMAYTHALIEGYRVVFSDGDRRWNYHTDTLGNFILCDKQFNPGGRQITPSK